MQTKPSGEVCTQTSIPEGDHILPNKSDESRAASVEAVEPIRKKKTVGKKASSPLKFKSSSNSSESESKDSDSSNSHSDEGSEFGDNYTQRDIQKKLPLVQKDIANMLKLDVKRTSYNLLSIY